MVKVSKTTVASTLQTKQCNNFGISKGNLFYHVRTGKITKTIDPTKKEGYYDKKEIDKNRHRKRPVYPNTFHGTRAASLVVLKQRKISVELLMYALPFMDKVELPITMLDAKSGKKTPKSITSRGKRAS